MFSALDPGGVEYLLWDVVEMSECTVTAELGTLMTLTGAVAADVAVLRAQFDAVTGQSGTGFVAVDLSAAVSSGPALFVVLAENEARLRAKQSRLVIIGMHPGVLKSLDETPLSTLFTLYRAARERAATTSPDDPESRVVAAGPSSGGGAAGAVTAG